MPTDREIDWGLELDPEDPDVGATVSVNEAAGLLLSRLRSINSRMVARASATVGSKEGLMLLMRRVVETLPEEALREGYLSTMDLRPVLMKLQPEGEDDYTTNGVEFSNKERSVLRNWFVETEQHMRSTLETQLADAGVPLDQLPMYVDDLMNESRENGWVLGPSPVVEGSIVQDPTTGEIVAANGNAATNDIASQINDLLNGTSTGPAAPAFLTEDDVKIMLSTDTPGSVIGRYYDDLSLREAFRAEGGTPPADQLRVNLGAISPNDRPRPTNSDTSSLAGIEAASTDYGRSYTLSQAMKLPLEMNRQQIKALTDQMKKAGIFAQIEGGEPSVSGDPTDPQFKRAYQLLLAKAIERGENVPTVLREDRLAYEESIDEAVRTRLTDPARLRIAADTIAQSQLGRKLSKSEVSKYVRAIHEMEREQAGVEFDEDGGDVTDVDWEARMTEMITGQNPGETEAHDTFDQYQAFTSMLAGPGRGL